MEPLSTEVARLFAAKQERRHKLASLSFPEKVRVVVQLQRMVAPILRTRGRQVRAWDIEGPSVIAPKGPPPVPSPSEGGG